MIILEAQYVVSEASLIRSEVFSTFIEIITNIKIIQKLLQIFENNYKYYKIITNITK